MYDFRQVVTLKSEEGLKESFDIVLKESEDLETFDEFAKKTLIKELIEADPETYEDLFYQIAYRLIYATKQLDKKDVIHGNISPTSIYVKQCPSNISQLCPVLLDTSLMINTKINTDDDRIRHSADTDLLRWSSSDLATQKS